MNSGESRKSFLPFDGLKIGPNDRVILRMVVHQTRYEVAAKLANIVDVLLGLGD